MRKLNCTPLHCAKRSVGTPNMRITLLHSASYQSSRQSLSVIEDEGEHARTATRNRHATERDRLRNGQIATGACDAGRERPARIMEEPVRHQRPTLPEGSKSDETCGNKRVMHHATDTSPAGVLLGRHRLYCTSLYSVPDPVRALTSASREQSVLSLESAPWAHGAT